MGTTLRLANCEEPSDQIFVYMEKGLYVAIYDVTAAQLSNPEEAITDEDHRACYQGHALSVIPQTLIALDNIAMRLDAVSIAQGLVKERIEAYKFIKNGEYKINVEVFTRDCDHREQTALKVIPATLEAYNELFDEVERNTENGFSVSVISEEQARYFEPSDRDRVMEAYEDGHPHIIY